MDISEHEVLIMWRLLTAALNWITAALDLGQEIPEPEAWEDK